MNYVLLLGLLLILGLISTRVTRLGHFPNVTGFLIIGLISAVICIVLDNFNIHLPGETNNLVPTLVKLNEIISSIALGFIALSIGQEFKLSRIKEFGGKILLITILQAFLACVLVDGALLAFCLITGTNLSIAFILGAIATATAPAATIMVIHQYKAHGKLVDILLPVVAFDDAIGLILFAVSVSIAKLFVCDSEINVFSIAILPLINIFGSLILGFIIGLLMHGWIKLFKSRNNHIVTLIAFTLLAVGLCIAINKISINGENFELSNLLTCMMVGATYVNLAHREQKEIVTRDIELMDRWTPFLFTLFFVLSGSHLATSAYDIFDSTGTQLLTPIFIIFGLYIIFRSGGKYLGSFAGCKITKQESNVTKYLGLTLLPQAGVAIGMANQISQMEVFKENNIANIIVTVVLCATLVYELVGPLITKWSLKKAGEIDPENL